jgi:hypothetical protein
MKIIYSLLFISAWISVSAQTVHVTLFDLTTNKPISNAKVKSNHDHDLITFSNDTGYFAFNLTHNDTILIVKDYYYPVYVSLNMHNFDSTHIITLRLTPSSNVYKGPNQFNNMNLQSFEYHFIHDQVGEKSQAHITVFQTKDAIKFQNKWDQNSFKFAAVDIFKHPSSNSQHNYILNQPTGK